MRKNTKTTKNKISVTQDAYDKVIKELKHERRKVRKINRETFNDARVKAAEKFVESSIQQQLDKVNTEYRHILFKHNRLTHMKKHSDFMAHASFYAFMLSSLIYTGTIMYVNYTCNYSRD
jgi:hypothetical protein